MPEVADPTVWVRLKTFKPGRRGKRGFVMSLPVDWVSDVQIGPEDRLTLSRDVSDRLLITVDRRGGVGA
jgi:hypothetical protein